MDLAYGIFMKKELVIGNFQEKQLTIESLKKKKLLNLGNFAGKSWLSEFFSEKKTGDWRFLWKNSWPAGIVRKNLLNIGNL